ncbi:Oidioi.mRNA.OKI2018_I69.chr1.g626.t1.cds [Oikopleura dioica]|uniref:Oidioi.mRNA.OKI2018_I69.chr1.g626.t1.cds n=1 Tax=Oikopleura dioica TaxID=34765 RepID=A0ABN7SKX5_OIKDI|nr:Oidioi.mRNA.OKI2018_I69.chr1.g626.t1.cds [Oikopleura dioica]
MRFLLFFGLTAALEEDQERDRECLDDLSALYFYEEYHCGYYKRIETCEDQNLAMAIAMECDENLIFGLSRFGVSVFFTTLSIFTILSIHWKFEPPIQNKFYKAARIISIVFLIINIICAFVAMRKTPIHERWASGVASVVFNALNILPVGVMYYIRASGNI